MSHLQSALEHHKTRLRNAGYKLTNARITVLQVIQDLGGHVTSTEVLDAVARVDEAIGRASVFRTLDLLTQLGIIRPTYIETSQTPTYVMLPGGHHHRRPPRCRRQVLQVDRPHHRTRRRQDAFAVFLNSRRTNS